MAKQRKKTTNNKKNRYNNIDIVNTSFKEESWKVIKTLVIVLIFLGCFYLFTTYIVNKNSNSSTNDTNKSSSDAVIQYQEIIAGTSFDIDKDEYLVLYYDKSIDNLKSDITSLISDYEAIDSNVSIYTVDMSSAFNKKFAADEDSNKNPNGVDDLRIVGPTLIKFSNGKVDNYIEGYDSIREYLQ